jgi:N-acetylglucosamine-6-phosphate deacetylase
MTTSTSPEGYILTPGGWAKGKISFAGNQIGAVDAEAVDKGATAAGPYLIPGFIDLHVHGGGGADWQGGEGGIRKFIRFHASHGTTAMAPTTAMGTLEAIETSLAAITKITAARGPGEPVSLGAHLEGPFINPMKPGAMNVSQIREGDPALAKRWAETYKITIATVAPEAPGGLEVMKTLAATGCRCQIGHSLATPAQAAEAFRCGCAGFTHLFNAMSQMEHREPGVAAYAMAKGTYAEIVSDLLHVDPTVLLAAYRAIPKLYAITDATAAGAPDGTFDWGGRKVIKKGQRITLANGTTLAGSAITMLDAFRNLVGLGLTIAQAVEMTSGRQAEYLALGDLGRIAVGARGCVVKLDAELRLLGIWADGESVPVGA